MKSSDFKSLKEKINSELTNMHNTFLLRGKHYVFHDDEMSEYDSSKHGISFILDMDDIRINKFLLLDLVSENGRTRYTNSKEISSGYYILTNKQKEELVKILNSKSGAIEI